MKHPLNTMKYVLIILSLLTFYSCAQDKENNMTVFQLKEAMKNDSLLVVLDVRTPQELNGPLGKIDGLINIPVQELEQRISELAPYKNKNIAVICRSGNRSRTAQQVLNRQGFNAKNVSGGMIEFRKSEGK
jgi:rhodanese-related sulfurtransferase